MSRRVGIAGIVVAAAALGFGTWTRLRSAEAVRPAPPPVVITPEATQAAGSVSEFTFDLYRRVAADRDGNIFISPYSVAGALLMVAEGARGEAASEIGTVLHFPDSARNAGDASRPWRTSGQLTAFGTLNRSLMPADEAGVAMVFTGMRHFRH